MRGSDCIFIYRQFKIQLFCVLSTQCIYVLYDLDIYAQFKLNLIPLWLNTYNKAHA